MWVTGSLSFTADPSLSSSRTLSLSLSLSAFPSLSLSVTHTHPPTQTHVQIQTHTHTSIGTHRTGSPRLKSVIVFRGACPRNWFLGDHITKQTNSRCCVSYRSYHNFNKAEEERSIVWAVSQYPELVTQTAIGSLWHFNLWFSDRISKTDIIRAVTFFCHNKNGFLIFKQKSINVSLYMDTGQLCFISLFLFFLQGDVLLFLNADHPPLPACLFGHV